MTDQQPDNARAKKRVDMTQKPTVTHYENGTVLLTRPDKTIWFGLVEHLQYNFVDVKKP